MLEKFFAVTRTSIYFVQVIDNFPVLKKIALKGKSDTSIGEVLNNGTMLSIGKQLILFVPEGGGNSFEKNIAMVNTRYWGGNTSKVTALFLNQKDAESCFNKKSDHDEWVTKTREVLEKIGEDHPHFVIAKQLGYELEV